MAQFRRTLIVFALLATACARDRAQSGSSKNTASSGHSEFQPLRTVASATFSEASLGFPYRADFEPVRGRDGQSLFEASISTEPRGDIDVEYKVVEESQGDRASVGILSFDIGGSSSSGKTYFVLRAYELREAKLLRDQGVKIRRPPKGAAYYPSAVLKGHAFEIVFEADSRSTSEEMKLSFEGLFGLELESWAKRHKLKTSIQGRGLKASGPELCALQKKDPRAAMAECWERTDPVPLFVEWTPVPGFEPPAPEPASNTKIAPKACTPGAPGCEPCRTWHLTRIKFIAPKRLRNGTAWPRDKPFRLNLLTAHPGAWSIRTSRPVEFAAGERHAEKVVEPALEVRAGENVWTNIMVQTYPAVSEPSEPVRIENTSEAKVQLSGGGRATIEATFECAAAK
jgi:hypothetical protein